MREVLEFMDDVHEASPSSKGAGAHAQAARARARPTRTPKSGLAGTLCQLERLQIRKARQLDELGTQLQALRARRDVLQRWASAMVGAAAATAPLRAAAERRSAGGDAQRARLRQQDLMLRGLAAHLEALGLGAQEAGGGGSSGSPGGGSGGAAAPPGAGQDECGGGGRGARAAPRGCSPAGSDGSTSAAAAALPPRRPPPAEPAGRAAACGDSGADPEAALDALERVTPEDFPLRLRQLLREASITLAQ